MNPEKIDMYNESTSTGEKVWNGVEKKEWIKTTNSQKKYKRYKLLISLNNKGNYYCTDIRHHCDFMTK